MRFLPWVALTAFAGSYVAAGAPIQDGAKDKRRSEKKPATLVCKGASGTVNVTWHAEVEAPDGPGRFDLVYAVGETREADEVTPYEPMFDPLSDPIRYDTGWASKDFRTTLRLYVRDGKLIGDYESPNHAESELRCENNLPIRGADLSFPDGAWSDVTTQLLFIDDVRFRRDEAITRDGTVLLPVRFTAGLVDTEKLFQQLKALPEVKRVVLMRVDGSAVPTEETEKPAPPAGSTALKSSK